jgi:hypothetical protein
MDSMERLAHSLEQAVALIHSLRRENRDLARAAAAAKAAEARAAALEGLGPELAAVQAALAQAQSEAAAAEERAAARLREEPAQAEARAAAEERARQAELEAARLAAMLEDEREGRMALKAELEGKLRDMELKWMAASREETMPLPDRTPELEGLALRCSELEAMLAAAQAEIESGKGEATAMQVRIAALGAEADGLRGLALSKEAVEAERASLRRQRKALAQVAKERETTRRKLDEIYAALDNMRLG